MVHRYLLQREGVSLAAGFDSTAVDEEVIARSFRREIRLGEGSIHPVLRPRGD